MFCLTILRTEQYMEKMGFIYEISGKYRENRELHKKKKISTDIADYFSVQWERMNQIIVILLEKMVKGKELTVH